MPIRFTALVYVLAGMALNAAPASAVTIDTFDFTQVGYVDLAQDNVFTSIYGSFSGIPDQAGFISLSSLTAFSVTGINVTPAFFSFDENGGSSSLDVALSNAAAITDLCIGATAAFGGNISGVNCGPGEFNGYDQDGTGNALLFGTQDLPVVTLVSSTTTTPEPATLLPVGLVLLGCLTILVRRSGIRVVLEGSPQASLIDKRRSKAVW